MPSFSLLLAKITRLITFYRTNNSFGWNEDLSILCSQHSVDFFLCSIFGYYTIIKMLFMYNHCHFSWRDEWISLIPLMEGLTSECNSLYYVTLLTFLRNVGPNSYTSSIKLVLVGLSKWPAISQLIVSTQTVTCKDWIEISDSSTSISIAISGRSSKGGRVYVLILYDLKFYSEYM